MSTIGKRIERLEMSGGNRRKAVIVVNVDETVEAAMERHFAEHPEDRDASDPLVVQLVDPTKNTINGDQHMSLTPIQARFLNEYLAGFNTLAAAIRAGYDKKTAKQDGLAVLNMPTVQAAVTRGTEARDSPKGESSDAEITEDRDDR